ncbi:MAG: insulinase family protein, partial [Chloroflexi bacterium]|nr:insulinase family protein [Chloroflexota bacterium]
RNEPAGKTGISHWVEHMQFKGTKKYPINVLDKEISRDGGVWNAMTSLDWTTYFETMPADKIDIAIDLEADRMRNSLFEEDETSLERTVVISEREGNENEPLFRLGESIQKAAFNRHSYAHQVIGDLQDLQTISRDDLYVHYRNHYTPDNTLIAVTGDFETEEMINKYLDAFGAISDKRKDFFDPEPERKLPDSHTIEIDGPGDTVYLQLTFRSPDAQSEDFFPLVVLDSLLTGPTSLAMFGGGSISNKTSRLYRALVEKDLAASISAGVQATIDPYVYEILAILQPNHPLEKVRMIIDDEIDRLKNGMVSEEEIQRAIKQAKALFAYGSESITNQTFWLGYSSMFADHTWFENYLSQLEQVTPQKVAETAKKYLDPNRRIVGVYKPRENRK